MNRSSLRDALLVLLLATGLIPCQAYGDATPEEIAHAIDAIRRKGGTVRLDLKRDDVPPIEVDLDGAGDGNRVLEQVKLFSGLEILRLDGSQVDDRGVLEHLPAMTNLRTLSLGENLSDAALKSLSGLTKLETLYVGSRVTDTGLSHLRHLTRLRELYFSGAQITDSGLQHLKNVTQLETLLLAGTKISDAGLAHLKSKRRLKTLSLSFTEITDVGLAELKELKQLRRLFVTGTRVTKSGVEELKKTLREVTIGPSEGVVKTKP